MAASFGSLPGAGGTPVFGFNNPGAPPPPQSGGNWIFDAAKGLWSFVKNNAGDILQTGAGVAEGFMSSQDRAKQLEELKRQYDASLAQRQSEYDRGLAESVAQREQSGQQFNRTTGDTEAQAAVRAQTQLNAAPLADKSQALLLARMGVAPGQFQGRDFTKGTNDLLRAPVAPSAPVTSAMQAAAAGYKPGQGGVDTSTIKMLLDKMRASGMGPGPTGTVGSGTPIAPRPRGPARPQDATPVLQGVGGGITPTAGGLLRRRMGIT